MRFFIVLAIVALSLISCKENKGGGVWGSKELVMVPESVRLVQPSDDARKAALLVFDSAQCRYRPTRKPSVAQDGYVDVVVIYQFERCSNGSLAGSLLAASNGVQVKLVSPGSAGDLVRAGMN